MSSLPSKVLALRRRLAAIGASVLRDPQRFTQLLGEGFDADDAGVYLRRGNDLRALHGDGAAPPGPACRAADAGGPIVAGGSIWLAAWCRDGVETPPIGLVALRFDRPLRVDPESLEDLELLSIRLGIELSWLQVHQRMAVEHERLRATSLIDPLTGVWTRTAFDHTMQVEIAAARRRDEHLTFAIFDIDELGRINDRHGHPAGDAVLGHVTAMIRANVRVNDELCRFGGDELGLLLMNADLERGQQVVQKLVARINDTPLAIAGERVPFTVRAGVAAIEPDDSLGDPAFERAIAACDLARTAPTRVARCQTGELPPAPLLDPSADAGTLIGATLGGTYRVLHEINRGGSGVVYRGEDLGLSRPVAIKVLRPDLGRDQKLIERFRREATILAALRHPNLVDVYAFRAAGEDQVYFVMELVEGPTVADLIEDALRERTFLDVDAVAEVIAEIGDALEAMHTAGLIHCDVKPLNVILDRKASRAVLVDVGESRESHGGQPRNGTPSFAAPESFGEQEESTAVDVYALAATAYTMLTGQMPFGTGDALAILARQLDGPPVPPSSLRRALPDAVDSVLAKGLAVDPAQRYSTPSALAVALRAALRAADRQRSEKPMHDRAGQLSALTIENHLASVELRHVTQPMVRGAAFRVAAKVIAARVGEPWLRRLGVVRPDLAPMLAPSLPPMSWHPLEHLIALASSAGEEAEEILRSTGRGMVSVTFRHVYGAEFAHLTTLGLLTSVPRLWSRYFAVGEASTVGTGDRCVVLAVSEPPGARELLAGFLERVAELTGAADVHVTAGPLEGGVRVFTVGWTE